MTTARTTAFMPALSPPEVRTASFILYFGGVVVIAIVAFLDVADGNAESGFQSVGGRPKDGKSGSAERELWS